MSKSLILLCLAFGGLVGPVAAMPPARPAVSGFSLSPARFAVGDQATRIRFRLSRPATIRIAIARKVEGRMSHGRCVKRTPRLRGRRTCTRHVRIGTVTRRDMKAGRHSLGFSGRVRSRALRPGRYRATIAAIDGRRRRSTRSTTFRVIPAGGPPGQTPNPSPPPTPPPAPGGFPNSGNTGTPPGWTPATVQSSDLHVTTPGAVVQDVLLQNGANLIVDAPNVTVRRVRLEGGQINNDPGGSPCRNGLVVEDSTFALRPGQEYDATGTPAIQWGGYTARRVQIWYRSEGLFVGGKSAGCGPVTIEDSLIKLDDNNDCELHADGIQGYDGNEVTIRNVVADSDLATCGTAPFFYPHSQGNTSATVDRLLVIGGGYSFRLGMPATVSGLRIVDRAWAYGPMDVRCPAVSAWDASVVEVDANYRVVRTVRNQPCNTNGGS